MIFDIVNIEEELTKERSREEDPQKSLLKEIQNILYLSTSNDADVLHRLRQKSDSENKDLPQLDEQDRKKLYSISQVKKICIKYKKQCLEGILRFFSPDLITHERLPAYLILEIQHFHFQLDEQKSGKNYRQKQTRKCILSLTSTNPLSLQNSNY